MERVLAEVKDRYTRRNMETHWYIFQDRLLRPTLEGHDPPSLRQICQKYDIESEATASNMLNTVKKLVRSVLKSHVRQTVVSGEVTAEELKEILQFFEKDGKN